jgi:AAA15 family ATPase/GTPase
MLIEFRVRNYRSFCEEQVLRLGATRITEFEENTFEHPSEGKQLLKAIAVYGANSSGKSNLLRAMGMMRHILFTSFQLRSSEEIPFDPFLLDEGSAKSPTGYEITFGVEDRIYRYGFEHDNQAFTEEWLFDETDGKDEPLFVREGDGIQVFEDAFPEGADLESKTRTNALFLSVVDQFDGEVASRIIRWFNAFNTIDGLGHDDYRAVTFRMLEQAESRKKLLEFYRDLDLGFEDIVIEKAPFDPEKLRFRVPQDIIDQMTSDMEGRMMASLSSVHRVKTGTGTSRNVRFNVRTQESSGTNKVIDLSGPIFDTLLDGGVLIVDELDAKLHPHLTITILKLFQLPETNPKNAQIVFATHNTNILSLGRLRRDQIIFAEKGSGGSTKIYPLVNYKLEDNRKVRKDNSFEKDYLLGRYGGIPAIEDITKLN